MKEPMTEIRIALPIQVAGEHGELCGKNCPPLMEADCLKGNGYCSVDQFDMDCMEDALIIDGKRCKPCLAAEEALKKMIAKVQRDMIDLC